MGNEFAMETKSKPEGVGTEMVISRQAQEVQAAMVIAKKFPRDEAIAYDRIMRACRRSGLAEQSEYTYPRGTTKVNGPTIRLAEAIAQNWGNVDYGIIELGQRHGCSDMMAYAWDLETNTRVTKIFSVKHIRDTKKGSSELTDVRDIYEATANFGARRVRACILGVIPGDVVDAAIQECRKTLKGMHKEPLEDRFRKMIVAFEKDFMVSKAQVEEYLGYDIKAVDENDFIRMQGVYRSLRDGMSEASDFFRPIRGVEDPFEKKQTQKDSKSPPSDSVNIDSPLVTPKQKEHLSKLIGVAGLDDSWLVDCCASGNPDKMTASEYESALSRVGRIIDDKGKGK